MTKSNSKKVIISILNHFGKKELLILISKIKVLILSTKKVNITIINVNAYWTACKLKKTQVFIVFIKNLKY